ncbi:GRAM domain-containing protein 3 [Liparis tanakae]|uniref:GRAM domain-containing protein 3 n=1 Tax=Liparis tanakae TaxID=230148 RepID=A0A4Z2H6D9_9TELE|nr:GRAM domain-containing protein 3 [Liparis tanakae]
MVLMAEQADRPLTPLLSAPEQLSHRDSRGNRSELDHGGERRPRRRAGSPVDLQLCLDSEADPPESKRKPASMRLKPVEQPAPVLIPSDCETKFEMKKPQHSHLSKPNAQYHKLFMEVRREELLRQSYTCALQRDILYQGKMFLSDNWICFHSKVFGRDTKADKTSSSVISSCENSFRVKCPTLLPLVSQESLFIQDLSADFSNLDGVVQQRRQEMMESSSSGSQTPDYDKITDFTVLPDTFLSAVQSAEVSVHADVHLQTPSQKHGSAQKNGSPKLKGQPSQPMSLQAILLLYLFLVSVLVFSSCYMAFKIVALEHRLNSLVSVGQHIRNEHAVSHRPQEEVNAEIYGELSSNLFKLEKIQRNLRKLLEET